MKYLKLISIFPIISAISCKKDHELSVNKIVDYTIEEKSQLKTEFFYSDARVVEMKLTKPDGDTTIYKLDFGWQLLRQIIYNNGDQINYLKDDHEFHEIKSWDTVGAMHSYLLGNSGRIIGGLQYQQDGTIDYAYDYIYEDDNIVQKVQSDKSETYTCDKHRNPYERIRIPFNRFTLSKNNCLKSNGDTIARYEYNSEGYVSRAYYPKDVTIDFYYKDDKP